MTNRKKITWGIFFIGYIITCFLYVKNSFTFGEYTIQYLFWAGLVVVITNLVLDKINR